MTYYDDYSFQPILVFDESGCLVGSVLRPVHRPRENEAAAHIRRLTRSIHRHWPTIRILLRDDSHCWTPVAMDLCDTLGVNYVLGLTKTSRLREHVQAREATMADPYEQHHADKEKTAPVR